MTHKFKFRSKVIDETCFSRLLMFLIFVNCSLLATGSIPESKTSLLANKSRIVACPAFQDLFTGQLVASGNLSEANHSIIGALEVLGMNSSKDFQCVIKSEKKHFDLNHFRLNSNAGAFVYSDDFALKFILLYSESKTKLCLDSSKYTCFENYGSSERFQA